TSRRSGPAWRSQTATWRSGLGASCARAACSRCWRRRVRRRPSKVEKAMAKIHVVMKKEDLDGERMPGKVVVVLDVLFATSSIATALAHGALEVIPTLDGPSALSVASGRAAESFVLSGELNAITLEGFAQPTPIALVDEKLSGTTLIYSTTNGT